MSACSLQGVMVDELCKSDSEDPFTCLGDLKEMKKGKIHST